MRVAMTDEITFNAVYQAVLRGIESLEKQDYRPTCVFCHPRHISLAAKEQYNLKPPETIAGIHYDKQPGMPENLIVVTNPTRLSMGQNAIAFEEVETDSDTNL